MKYFGDNSRIIWFLILVNIVAAVLVIVFAQAKITIYLLAFIIGIVTNYFFSRFC